MTTFYRIELICPICGSNFSSNAISSCGYRSKRTDFRPNYWGFNPVEFLYHQCPECGFCAAHEYIKLDIDNPAFREEILLRGFKIANSLEQKLEYAMLCWEAMNDFGIISLNEFELANSWIEAFWWALEPNQARKTGEIVIKYFIQALEKNLVPEDQIIIIRYLIAEIYRRIGQMEIADRLFDEVISLTTSGNDEKWVQDLAVQQKTNPQENLSDQPSIHI